VHLKFSFSRRISARSGFCLQDVFFVALNHLATSARFDVWAFRSCAAQEIFDEMFLRWCHDLIGLVSVPLHRCSDFALSVVSFPVISVYLTQFQGPVTFL
jgi:hypothetical protein